MAKTLAKKMVKRAAPKRKRAHKADGSFKADDPTTPDINEAFVQQPAPEVHREAQRAVGLRRLGGKLIG